MKWLVEDLKGLENFDTLSFNLSKEDVAFMDGFYEGFRICNDPMGMW